MTEPIEIEAKFDLDDVDRDTLLAVTTVGPFSVIDREGIDQEDIYYDTGDARLAAVGATLRVRRTATVTRMTFKGARQAATSSDEEHIASRLEDEVSLDETQAGALSLNGQLPELPGVTPLERARELTGTEPLVPVARMQNARTTLTLAGRDTTLDLSVDRCIGTRLSDGRSVSFNEVELESTSGARAAVLEASSALQQLVPSLRPSRETKLGRTLG